MGWGMWGLGKVCPLPLKVIGVVHSVNSKLPCHRLAHAVLQPVRRTVHWQTHWASMLNEQRSVGHHTIQEVCTFHNSSIMMAAREDQYILYYSLRSGACLAV